VPTPRIVTDPAAIARVRAYNTRTARSLLWGNLVDQIEVNIFRCPRANGRLTPENFLQAVALFQRTQRLKVDGMLGPITWTRMKTIRAERDPFPRAPLNQDFDATPNAGLCEMRTHPAIDIGVVAGTPIPNVADGRVIYAGDVGTLQNCAVATGCANGTAIVAACATLSYGRAVIVEHPNRGPGTQPGGASVYTVYAHVQFRPGRRVATGEPVVAGRILAEVGADCVGFSTGAHLHYVVVSGVRQFRLRAGPSRPQTCGRFWPAMTPQRPRSNASAAAFRW
jgi:murein DD-endopeptidase MepM/ murein hydrolase activator NlpD